MRTHFLVANLAIIAALALGMIVTRKARNLLSPEKKLEIIDRLSQLRLYALIPLVGLLFVMYIKPGLAWSIGGFVICIAAIYVAKWVTVRRIGVSSEYLQALKTEGLIVTIGLVVFLAAGLWPYYAR